MPLLPETADECDPLLHTCPALIRLWLVSSLMHITKMLHVRLFIILKAPYIVSSFKKTAEVTDGCSFHPNSD